MGTTDPLHEDMSLSYISIEATTKAKPKEPRQIGDIQYSQNIFTIFFMNNHSRGLILSTPSHTNTPRPKQPALLPIMVFAMLAAFLGQGTFVHASR